MNEQASIKASLESLQSEWDKISKLSPNERMEWLISKADTSRNCVIAGHMSDFYRNYIEFVDIIEFHSDHLIKYTYDNRYSPHLLIGNAYVGGHDVVWNGKIYRCHDPETDWESEYNRLYTDWQKYEIETAINELP